MPKAVVYGHSQAQPTGMGDDMVAGLKKRGYTVVRKGLAGKNDKQLLANIAVLGDVSDAELVFLYAGGNSGGKPTVADLTALINAFGANRTTVILPPVNLDRAPADVASLTAKNATNKAGIQHLVPVYTVAGHAGDFKSDTYHMKAGTALGKALVDQILDSPTAKGAEVGDDPDTPDTPDDKGGGGGGATPPQSAGMDLVILLAAVAGGALLAGWLKKRDAQ